MKLSDDLEYWRADRPDEYTMDRFIMSAKALEGQMIENDKFFNKVIELYPDILERIED